MKTLLLVFALLAQAGAAHAAEPEVSVSIEPKEGLNLIYAPMGAASANDAATGRLWFKLAIQNTGASPLTLTRIRVTIGALDVSIPRNLLIGTGGPVSTALIDDREQDGTTNEIITIPHPAAATATIRLYFAGNLTPKTLLSNLAPYTPPVPGGKFYFFAREGDIGPEEYFSDGLAHGPAAQHWGADWKVYRIDGANTHTTLEAGTDGTQNEHSVGWGVPIRAIADGVVLRTSTGWINNPAPGKRALQKMDEFDGEPIADVKVTALSRTRAASLQRLPSGQVQVSVWDLGLHNRDIQRLGSSSLVAGEFVADMAIVSLSATRVAGVLRLSNNNTRLVVWDISAEGLVTRPNWDVETSAVLEVSIAKLASNLFVVGQRLASDSSFVVTVWRVDGGLDPVDSDAAGVATSICTTALSGSRIAASLRSDDGRLKVIVWDFVNGLLFRQDDELAENISRVAAAYNDGDRWVTAFRTSPGGALKLARWSYANGTITADLVTTAHATQDAPLAISPATGSTGTDHVVTTSIVAGNVFQINGWGAETGLPGVYDPQAANTAGAVTAVSIDENDPLFFVAGARTTGGNLRINTWRWASGGGNSVYVLHGNCRVLYAHFQDGSVDTDVLLPGATVAAGQVLGRLGNSGKSGGPHCHVNSSRVKDGVTLQQLFDAEQAIVETGDDSAMLALLDGDRPMPYSEARAMAVADIVQGGESNPANAFATLNNQGMYDVSLGIRPGIDTRYVDPTILYAAPNGRKEPRPGNPATGGPYPIPSFALGGAVPSGGTLYIRGRSYDEAITLSTPMTIRRYDFYQTGGPVVIGK